MRCFTPQIVWHNKEAVFSIDFDPSTFVSPIYPAAPDTEARTDTEAPTEPAGHLPELAPSCPTLEDETAKNKNAEDVAVQPLAEDVADGPDKMETDEVPVMPVLEKVAKSEEIPMDVSKTAEVEVKEVKFIKLTPAPVPVPEASVPVEDMTPTLSDFYRFATGGVDSHLLVWHLRNPYSLKPEFTCVADLTRHSTSVNVVRFSGDGQSIASADDDAYIIVWRYDGTKSENEETQETWTMRKCLRKHYDDVTDLCWAKDNNILMSGSVDNSVVLWDVNKGLPIHVIPDHGGLVQGVAFDPLGEFAVSVCTDRTLRLFNAKTGKVLSRILKYPADWIKNNENESPYRGESKEEGKDNEKSKVQPLAPVVNRIFHDDTLRTFCRRPEFSPHGELLLVPGALLPPNQDSEYSPGKSKKRDKNTLHSTVVFCRNSFTTPCAIIPSGESYSVACRFCPVYFYRSRDVIEYDAERLTIKKNERPISCAGKLKPPKPEEKLLMDMPYRIVFAIATNDSVIIGDTESMEPLAIIANIHCTRLSDITWSSDGRAILVSSTDGFCSIITFEENELGRPYPMDKLPELTPTCFPIRKEPPKEPETKKKPKKKTEKIPLPKVEQVQATLLDYLN